MRGGRDAMDSEELDERLALAAACVRDADALLVSAGAGMGVDSGLSDFRGTAGFWEAYPPFAKLGLRFEQLADPAWFARDPHLAWGFYGHRLNLYRDTRPHHGFELLRRWTADKPLGWFVFTSNVDGHFQRAGFRAERVVECHGSLSHLQCAEPCTSAIWRADGLAVDVDLATMRAADPLPRCPACGGVARPNVLMFGDGRWGADRTEAQYARYADWLEGLGAAKLVVIECGAGSAVPSVRNESHRLIRLLDAALVRINPREPQVPPGHVGIPLSARQTLEAIDGLGAV